MEFSYISVNNGGYNLPIEQTGNLNDDQGVDSQMNDAKQLQLMAASGYAAMIPGVQLAIDHLQSMVNDLRRQLLSMQQPASQAPAKRGRPPKAAATGSRPADPAARRARSGWSSDPAARKREMKRRQAKRKHQAEPTHPRDANHPDHAKWLRKMRAVQSKRWAEMTPTARQARLDVMTAGRAVKAA